MSFVPLFKPSIDEGPFAGLDTDRALVSLYDAAGSLTGQFELEPLPDRPLQPWYATSVWLDRLETVGFEVTVDPDPNTLTFEGQEIRLFAYSSAGDVNSDGLADFAAWEFQAGVDYVPVYEEICIEHEPGYVECINLQVDEIELPDLEAWTLTNWVSKPDQTYVETDGDPGALVMPGPGAPTSLFTLDTLGAASVVEGNIGDTPATLTYTVTRSGDLSVAATIDYRVEAREGWGINFRDFEGQTIPEGTLSFAPGQSEVTFEISIRPESWFDGRYAHWRDAHIEIFDVVIHSPVSTEAAGLGMTNDRVSGVIINDDPAPDPELRFFGTQADDRFIGHGGDEDFLLRWGVDRVSGGDGADQFIFDARYVAEDDHHRIFDLNFAEGDRLSLRYFGDKTVIIDSEAEFQALVNAGAARVFTAENGALDVLFTGFEDWGLFA